MPLTDRLLTQGEVEAEIIRLSERLEDSTNLYATLCEAEARAEIAYKERHDTLLVHQANRTAVSGERTLAAVQAATVRLSCKDEFATYRINDARTKSCKEALLSLRHQLDALRTLAANIRAQT